MSSLGPLDTEGDSRKKQKLDSETEKNTQTHTEGKATFHEVYNAPDAAPYMREMNKHGYVIGDNTARVSLRAIDSLFGDSSGSSFAVARTASQPPVLMELCAGYGLSMALIKTTRKATELMDTYTPERPPLNVAKEQDKAFITAALKTDLPPMCVVGVDVAEKALAYGKEMGLFDATIAKNLEEEGSVAVASGNTLSKDETDLCARAELVLATGAFSYITVATLRNVFACREAALSKGGRLPVFLFFPLVSTNVESIIKFFKDKGLEVYYEPAKHWLPQRRFADAAEAEAIASQQASVLKKAGDMPVPACAAEGHLHATVLIAGPAGISSMAPHWIPFN